VKLALLVGSAHPSLGEAIGERLQLSPLRRVISRFPDSELHIELQDSARGTDLFIVQPTSPPADPHLIELLLLADAARRAGAARVTAVIPYFGYARQDRRASGREPVGARVMADAITRAGRMDRVVAVDLHTGNLEGVFGVPLEHLSAVALLTEATRRFARPDTVVVSPDLGAVRLAQRYADGLDLPVAIVHKVRTGGETVTVRGLTGQVRDRAAIIVDDMISTGHTIAAAVKTLRSAGAAGPMVAVATHGLFVGDAGSVLGRLGLQHILVTDTVPPAPTPGLAIEQVSVATLLTEAIRRLHQNESLGDLIAHR
jgi:ribose-phosphate pyrophosphokinase